MTDEEKLVACDRIMQIVEDEMVLETHQANSIGYESIQFHRLDAYRKIVGLLKGVEAKNR